MPEWHSRDCSFRMHSLGYCTVLYISFKAMGVVFPDPGVLYVCRILHRPWSYYYLRLGAKSYVLTVHAISRKRCPRYLLGRCDFNCDFGRAELTATIAEHVETTCHSFQYYNYREAWSQWRVSKSYSTYVVVLAG
jgi:hypothetical protein